MPRSRSVRTNSSTRHSASYVAEALSGRACATRSANRLLCHPHATRGLFGPRVVDLAHDAVEIDGFEHLLETPGELNVGRERAVLVQRPNLLSIFGREQV